MTYDIIQDNTSRRRKLNVFPKGRKFRQIDILESQYTFDSYTMLYYVMNIWFGGFEYSNKINVWCGILYTRFISAFFFEGNSNENLLLDISINEFWDALHL